MSFHNDVDALSNCTKIHYNRLQNMSGVEPDTWSFLESATSIQCESYRDVDKLAKKKAISRGTPSVKALIDLAKIKHLLELLESGGINELEFSQRGVSAAEQLVRNLIFINPRPKSEFEIVDLVPIHHKLSNDLHCSLTGN
ncbi:uncharacterized protein LOC123271287 [Cotesia glomerata]|uniref:uncharacterized protein LOC123271287 n=1 Tax=Cotesia glomerata TaxID=32391 RepID=UPI001D011356|nr:uncharacterized protein LOC123271287 [Cotesia glomerata]